MIYSNKNSVFKNLINWLDPSLYVKTRGCVMWNFTSTSFMLEMKESFYDLISLYISPFVSPKSSQFRPYFDAL